MKNWKTTLAGFIGAIALSLQSLFATGAVDGKTAMTAVIVAGLGFLAKDFNVTGGTK
jgi:hypothetical protein